MPTKDDKRIVRKEREPDANFDVLETQAGPDEVYVDGSVGTNLSASVVKIDFFTLTGVKSEGEVSVEQRLVKLRLVMPTAVFFEFCVKSLTGFKEKKFLVQQGLDRYREGIMKHLSSVMPEDSDREK